MIKRGVTNSGNVSMSDNRKEFLSNRNLLDIIATKVFIKRNTTKKTMKNISKEMSYKINHGDEKDKRRYLFKSLIESNKQIASSLCAKNCFNNKAVFDFAENTVRVRDPNRAESKARCQPPVFLSEKPDELCERLQLGYQDKKKRQ